MKRLFTILILLSIISVITGHSPESEVSNSLENLYKNNPGLGGNKISRVISEIKQSAGLKEINIFEFQKDAAQNDQTSSFVKKATILKLDRVSVSKLLKNKEKNIILGIPVSGDNILQLELTESFPLSEDFVLINKSKSDEKTETLSSGLHYRGIIKGKENSTAAVSIFGNFVMGLISDETGNYVLGSIKNSDNTYSDNYIFYNDADLTEISSFKCGVDDDEEKFIIPYSELNKNLNLPVPSDNPLRLPVKVYFETDFLLYQQAGGNVDTLVSFVSGLFNQVALIYQNESIPFEISGFGYWTSQDPYALMNDSYEILTTFGGNSRDDFEGNIAHLLSTRNAGLGGIAWIRVLCYEFNPADSSGRFAFSNIEPGYNPYPAYSWSVNVVTHEMGHSLGSRHTHACVWPVNGNIQAIDSCYYSEGGCFSDSQIRPRVGTIMSYCHLWPVNQGGGVNLAFGFGPLPGDTIRLRYAQANCLDQLLNSSEQPSSFSLKQNFPNPFNPVTTITFALPVDSKINLKVYDVTGKLVANIIQNEFYATGFYDVEFNSENFNLSSGIYFYSLESEGTLIDTKRMVLIK